MIVIKQGEQWIVEKVDPYTTISAQLEALNRNINAIKVQQSKNCDFCGGNYPNHV